MQKVSGKEQKKIETRIQIWIQFEGIQIFCCRKSLETICQICFPITILLEKVGPAPRLLLT